MKNKNIEKQDFRWYANTNSQGYLNLDIFFSDTKISNEKKEKALADALCQIEKSMLQKGYLPPIIENLSPSDISKEYGHSRQYWEKLLHEGKIPYKKTSAGKITTNLWVEVYLKNKKDVDLYIKNLKEVLKEIKSDNNKSGTKTCPKCKQDTFEYFVNNNNVNGICGNKCGFKINTIIDNLN